MMCGFLHRYGPLALVFLAAVSCRTDVLDKHFPGGVVVEMENTVCGNGDTKAVSEDFVLSFQEGDRISVYPGSGDEYMIYPLKPSEGSAHARASFNVEGFSLKDGVYHSVFPAVLESCDPESIVLSLAGQKQEANNSSSHLAAYDYCWASAEISDNSGYFAFSHRVAWLKIHLPAGKRNSTFRQITISADNGVADTLVLNAGTGDVTAEKTASDFIMLDLGGGSGLELETGDTLIAFVCVPADTYTNLTVCTSGADGVVYSYTFAGDYELKKGNWYQLTIGKSDILFIGEMEDFGLYKCDADGMVKTWEPAVLKYRPGVGQVSWYKGKDCTIFEYYEVWTKNFTSFRVHHPFASLETGNVYQVDIWNMGECRQGNFELVRKSESSVWMVDAADGLGCIIKMDE